MAKTLYTQNTTYPEKPKSLFLCFSFSLFLSLSPSLSISLSLSSPLPKFMCRYLMQILSDSISIKISLEWNVAAVTSCQRFFFFFNCLFQFARFVNIQYNRWSFPHSCSQFSGNQDLQTTEMVQNPGHAEPEKNWGLTLYFYELSRNIRELCSCRCCCHPTKSVAWELYIQKYEIIGIWIQNVTILWK